MKYMKKGLALLLALMVVFPLVPVKAENFSKESGQLADGENRSGEEDGVSVSGDTVSTPNGEKKEVKKLAVKKKDVAEMAANGIDGVQPYAGGDIASGTDGNITWVIDANGKLTVTGNGDVTRRGFMRMVPWYNFAGQIISAEIDVTGMTDASYLFYGCHNLQYLNADRFDTSNVTNMMDMFSECWSLLDLNLKNFNTSNVTNMNGMFTACSSLTNLDVSSFDTSKVTEMSYMFIGCNNLTNLDVSGFDTSKVTDMYSTFKDCSSLASLNVSGFDTSKVTNMDSMFMDCSSLASLDVSGFDTSKVTEMSYMFMGCNNLTNLDVSGFDTSNLKSRQIIHRSHRDLV